MKKTKLQISLILICITLSFSAHARPNEEKALFELKTQIQDLLKKYPHSFTLEDDHLSKVEIILNDQNQMIVLNVDSEDPALVSYIRSRLNYKILKYNRDYRIEKIVVPIRFQK